MAKLCCDPNGGVNVADENFTRGSLSGALTIYGSQFRESNPYSETACPGGYQCLPCDTAAGIESSPVQRVITEFYCGGGCEAGSRGPGACVPCLGGDHCPPGTSNPLLHSLGVTCPDGRVCVPAAAAPPPPANVSRLRLEYDERACAEGHSCALGTAALSEATSCQARALALLRAALPPPALRAHPLTPASPSGLYCHTGTSGYETLLATPSLRMQTCAAGSFCRNASHEDLCPVGHYCKIAWSDPTECPSNSCPNPGQTNPHSAIVRTWLLAVMFLAIWAFSKALAWRVRAGNWRRAAAVDAAIARRQERRSQRVSLEEAVEENTQSRASIPAGFSLCRSPIAIAFHHLSLHLHGACLLDQVGGAFEPSCMAAVMGPSGCGKSTLLSTLCGRQPAAAEQGGCVLFNGQPHAPAALTSVIAFVPQDDTVYGDLTVLENVEFSARLRLAAAQYSPQARWALVSGVIEKLALAPLQNQLVGDVWRRGVSGGEKKRVSIAIEMVSDPVVLLLDEPTSGLAASDTVIVMSALHSLSLTGRTIVAVIHQPRYQVFMLFHDVMLLQRGGRLAYFGQALLASAFFDHLGFPVPPAENPADYFIDVVSGTARASSRGGGAGSPDDAVDLAEVWRDEVMGRAGGLEPFLGQEHVARLEHYSSSSGVAGTALERKTVASTLEQRLREPLLLQGLLAWDHAREALAPAGSAAASLDPTRAASIIRPALDPAAHRATATSASSVLTDREASSRMGSRGGAEARWPTARQIRGSAEALGLGDREMQALDAALAALSGSNKEGPEEGGGLERKAFKRALSAKLQSLGGEDTLSPVVTLARKTMHPCPHPPRTQESPAPAERVASTLAELMRERPGWAATYAQMVQREALQKLRCFDEVLSNLVSLALFGWAVGLFMSSGQQPFVPGDPSLGLMFAVIQAVAASMAAISALKFFGAHRVVRRREEQSGLAVGAAFLAKCTVDLVENAWQPVFFLGVCYNFIIPAQPLRACLLALCLCTFAASAVGILCSVVVSPGNETMATVLAAMLVAIFMNGTMVPYLLTVREGGLNWLWSLSFSRWTCELLLVRELEAHADEAYQELLVKSTITHLGYYYPAGAAEGSEEDARLWREYLDGYRRTACLALLALGVLLRCLSFALAKWLPWMHMRVRARLLALAALRGCGAAAGPPGAAQGPAVPLQEFNMQSSPSRSAHSSASSLGSISLMRLEEEARAQQEGCTVNPLIAAEKLT